MTDENRALLAHLFRRAAFGARIADLDTYASKGYNQAVNDLLGARSSTNPTSSLTSALQRTHTAGAAKVGTAGALPSLTQATLDDIQTAWVQNMVTTKAPLVERMTLFLSNHFATAYSLNDHIDVAAMTDQQTTIREFALGSFKDLAHKMIDDRALGLFLDNDKNIKGSPNENMARELMELFILGAGNYTEQDVKEVARSLTGYKLKKSPTGYSLTYDKALHDDGLKTVLGVTAAFTPHSVLDLLLSQPAAAEFIATKLVTNFVATKADSNLVSQVAASLRSNWNLSDALRMIFMSSPFKSASARVSRS